MRSEAIRLVVNADGFGSNESLSRGVLRAHRDGIVTSTSVRGNCPDVAAVKAQLDGAPELGVGVQIALVGGAPVSDAARVASLVDQDGQFLAQPRDVWLAWSKAALRPDDLERELDAQVARLRDAGLRIDHLNTQHSLGFLPVVGQALETVARRHGIRGIRTSMERPTLAWLTDATRGLATAALGALSWFTRRQMGTLRHGPQSWGYFESGRLDEVRILEIGGRLGPGLHELICAPTEDDAGQPSRELRALLSPRVREGLQRRDIHLSRWIDLF
jgi:predicted glycoside hydrolase/deacetylase ChbG (UPF0249 family)